MLKMIFVVVQAFACTFAAAQTAGRIEFLQGDARLIATDGTVRTALTNGLVQTGESIETGADAEVHIVLIDGGMLAVRGGSQIRLQSFRAQGDARDESTLQLVRGALRVVTGWVARINPRNVRYVTPNATIGVRGTDFDMIHVPTGGDAGSHTHVREGAVVMQSEGAEQVVGTGQAAASPTGARPRLHERVPEFITRSEGRNDGRVNDHGRQINRFMETSMRERRLLGKGESLSGGLERRRQDVERERGARQGEGSGPDAGRGPDASRGPDAGRSPDAGRGDGTRESGPRDIQREAGPRDGARPERMERIERIERQERIERPERPQRPERPDRPDRPRRPGG